MRGALMKVQELQQKLAQQEELILLDVREPEEVQVAPFFVTPPKLYLNLPMLSLLSASKAELEVKIFAHLGVSHTLPIVALCRSGNRSARACAQLRHYGWNVENFEGGIVRWQKEAV